MSKQENIKRALLVGINYRGTSAELHGCINDVNNVEKMLKEREFTEIKMLNEDVDELPTKVNIYAAWRWLLHDVKPGDVLVFHYSGHGGYVRDSSGDEADGRDETLIPLDYQRSGQIKDDTVRQLLVDKVPDGVTLICVFDCCHSGTGCDLRYNYINPEHNVLTTRKNYNYQNTKGTVICISGCKDEQTSADAWEPNVETNQRQAQGAMTYSLLTMLKKHNYSITYRKLISGMRRILARKRYTQIPQLSSGQELNLKSTFAI